LSANNHESAPSLTHQELYQTYTGLSQNYLPIGTSLGLVRAGTAPIPVPPYSPVNLSLAA